MQKHVLEPSTTGVTDVRKQNAPDFIATTRQSAGSDLPSRAALSRFAVYSIGVSEIFLLGSHRAAPRWASFLLHVPRRATEQRKAQYTTAGFQAVVVIAAALAGFFHHPKLHPYNGGKHGCPT